MQKVLQYLLSVKGEEMPRSASEFLQNNIPCTEVELEDRKEKDTDQYFGRSDCFVYRWL